MRKPDDWISCPAKLRQGLRCGSAPFKRAAITAGLAAGLLAAWLCAPETQAADLFPKGSNATLVFSPATIDDGEVGVSCAWNTSNVAVQVTFVFTGASTPPVQYKATSATIQAGDFWCSSIQAPGMFGASIVLQSPSQCSQATEYPGKCGVVASLEMHEVDHDVVGATHRHAEPVLKPASAGLQPLPIIPQ